ncbi:MAG: FAD-dependent oxidoreductase [Candidatus Abyssobacteria bacterium SURF_5]|uniref:FAD-dependent oxidoreductase n=1 Tax=Abyssobacteria bacterium (strain SURF_5) TaxID=2093360 RepID=A0A3A4NNR7_ABYX5|nr:MAG: FAD-dependent oxidoreductase [Candidatus Abyssubacteria bacterium SURF_5]
MKNHPVLKLNHPHESSAPFRCVAGDKISHAAIRQMLCCAVTGQGTGVAAAVSLKDKATCRDVDISTVQNALKKQGVRID